MKHRISKSFIIQIGFWNDKDDLQYPYAMIGIQRGLHIIENEQKFTAWKGMEVDDSYKAFNTEEFNCKGKWVDVCKKTYEEFLCKKAEFIISDNPEFVTVGLKKITQAD